MRSGVLAILAGFGSALPAAPQAAKNAVTAEQHKPNVANKQSPYDNSLYDTDHKVDHENLYHAPKHAPTDYSDDADEVRGKKGAVKVDDYNAERLGSKTTKTEKKADLVPSSSTTIDLRGTDVWGTDSWNTDYMSTDLWSTASTSTEAASAAKTSEIGISNNYNLKASDFKNKGKAKDTKVNPELDAAEDAKADTSNEYTKKADKVELTKSETKNGAVKDAKPDSLAVKDTKPGAKGEPVNAEKPGSAKSKTGSANADKVDAEISKEKSLNAQPVKEDKSSEINPKASDYKQKEETTSNVVSPKQETKSKPRGMFARFVGAAVMIVVSEIGDKTFFIAALMAMRHPPLFVFSSSYSAMVVMTVLSMVLGLILPSLLSRKVTTLLAALLFFVFGAKMVVEALGMDRSAVATEEMHEVENDILMHDKNSAMEKAEGGGVVAEAVEDDRMRKLHPRRNAVSLFSQVLSPVWIQIFAMTFLGEWGDRSQIATVAMGAGEGWFEVLSGCLLGHFLTTVLAVLGGKLLAQHLSLRTITFSGALCFLLFGVFYLKDWIDERA